MMLFACMVLVISGVYTAVSDPVQLVIDTDASFDVDDVVAICMANALMDAGEVDIKSIVHNAGYPAAIGAVSVLNTYYGREDIPLGKHPFVLSNILHYCA